MHAKDGFRNDIFQLSVTRNSTRKNLFNSGLHTPFIFSKGYIEVSTMLVNDIVYGLGQSNSLTFRHNFSIPRTWNLFSQYPNPHLKENQTENVTTMWGSHPFYLGIDDPERGDAHGVLLLNSFPITVTSNARPSLTFKTFGGHLEFVSECCLLLCCCFVLLISLLSSFGSTFSLALVLLTSSVSCSHSFTSHSFPHTGHWVFTPAPVSAPFPRCPSRWSRS